MRVVVLLTILCSVPLVACASDGSEWCGPAALHVTPDRAAPGASVTVSSPAAACDLGLGEGATYVVTLHSDTGRRGRPVEAPVSPEGAFSVEVPVPAGFPTGPASVLVTGSPLDSCGEGASCAAYTAAMEIE